MSLLDFSEIPPSRSPSPDVSAFEKFAKDFFITLYDATIEKTVGRGPDGGADLVVRVGEEKWLVSCKHYKNAIPRDDENAPFGDMQQWGCDRFIGFYSPEPSSGLETKLRQTAASQPAFHYQIFDNKDIERNLIASGSSQAWLLAFRWFPKSFAKIASCLVLPFSEYNRKDVLSAEGRSWISGIPAYAHYREDDSKNAGRAAEHLVSMANEIATDKAFAPIFIERIKDFSLALPGTFLRPTFVADEEVGSGSLYPSWDLDLVRDLSAAGNRKGLRNLCRIWSLWSLGMAEAAYYYGRQLMESIPDPCMDTTTADIHELCSLMHAQEEQSVFRNRKRIVCQDFSLSLIAAQGETAERGYFASLLCFGPLHLSPVIDREAALAHLAVNAAEQNLLADALRAIAQGFDEDDLEYVQAKSPNLLELLRSVRLIDPDYLDKLKSDHPGLACLHAPQVAPWRPSGQVNTLLAQALGFAP